MFRRLSTLLSLHRLKLRLQAFQAFLHTRIDLTRRELLAYLCEIHLCGELERHRHVPILEPEALFGVFDLHDGCGKRGDLVLCEVEILHFGRAFNIDTRLL